MLLALRVLHCLDHRLVEVLRHLRMVTVDEERSGAGGRIATCLEFEVPVIVGTAAQTRVGELDTVVGADGEELHRVWGHAETLRAFQVVHLGEVVLFRSERLDRDVPHVLVVRHRSLPVHVAALALLQSEQLVEPVAELVLRLEDN